MRGRDISSRCIVALALSVIPAHTVSGAGYKLEPQSAADEKLVEYFARETEKVQEACLSDIRTIEDWKRKKETYRKQLFEMLGLSPLPGPREGKGQRPT